MQGCLTNGWYNNQRQVEDGECRRCGFRWAGDTGEDDALVGRRERRSRTGDHGGGGERGEGRDLLESEVRRSVHRKTKDAV